MPNYMGSALTAVRTKTISNEFTTATGTLSRPRKRVSGPGLDRRSSFPPDGTIPDPHPQRSA
jgi:hypothetical protein